MKSEFDCRSNSSILVSRVYVWGMSGVGKSTLSKKLARELGYSFIDLDDLIESQTGESIKNIFAHKGEDEFRRIEERVLKNKKVVNVVIATGGGAPCFFDNAQYMLENGYCIYLKGNTNFILSRLETSKTVRPLLADALTKEEKHKIIDELMIEREPFYSKAHMKVDALKIDLRNLVSRLRSLLV